MGAVQTSVLTTLRQVPFGTSVQGVQRALTVGLRELPVDAAKSKVGVLWPLARIRARLRQKYDGAPWAKDLTEQSGASSRGWQS